MRATRRPRRSASRCRSAGRWKTTLEPLARAEPVEIDLGEGLTFRIAGRIDRIDRSARRRSRCSTTRPAASGATTGRARSTAAVVCSTRSTGLPRSNCCGARYKNPKVTAGVYYFSSHKGRQERVRIPAPTQAAIAGVLGDLRELIVQGSFVHAPDEDDCKFCDYAAACGEDVHEQAEAKLQRLETDGVWRLADA